MSESWLSIDVEAAVRKLALGRLKGPDKVPLAVVRWAASTGPDRLEVESGPRHLRVSHTGGAPAAEVLKALAACADVRLTEAARLAALTELETHGWLDALVCMVAAPEAVIDTGAPNGLRLRRSADGGVELSIGQRKSGLEVVLRGTRCTGPGPIGELVEHLRYADFPVWVDGRQVNRGLRLADALEETRFETDGWRAVVGLPARRLVCLTRVVVDGVVSEEVWTSPSDGLLWEAVICPPRGASGAVTEWVHGFAVRVHEAARREAGRRSSGVRRRLRELWFHLADCGAGAEALGEAAVFERADGRLDTVAALRASARAGVVVAMAPGERLARFNPGPSGAAGIFRLDEEAREFVERHLGLTVREPARRVRDEGRWSRPLRAVWRRLGRHLRSWGGRLGAGRVLPEDNLTTDERAFLVGLRTEVAPGTVVLCAAHLGGAWRWRRRAGSEPQLMLRRNARVVQRMVRAYERDPASLYPALMLLFEGHEAFGPRRPEAASRLVGLTEPDDGYRLGTEALTTEGEPWTWW